MNKIILELKKLDKVTYKIMQYGLLFSAFVAIIAVFVLLAYIFTGSVSFFHFGLILLKSSFSFAVEFIVCGFVVDFIRKSSL